MAAEGDWQAPDLKRRLPLLRQLHQSIRKMQFKE